MSNQVNIRLDVATVEQLDGWAVIRSSSRPEIIREALAAWFKQLDDERIAEEYRRAYEEFPETEDEMQQAYDNAHRLIEEEPWERPW